MTEALKRLYEAMGWEFHDTVTDLVATGLNQDKPLKSAQSDLTKGSSKT